MKTLLCFHGSPGSIKDFHQLSEKLRNLNVVAVPRETIPKDAAKAIVLGYSWGAAEALQWAATAPKKPVAIILVSPFLRAKSGRLSAIVLNAPIIGQLLWSVIGSRIVKSFLYKTASPATVTKQYLELGKSSLTRRAIVRSIKEKDIPQEQIQDAVQKTSEIPLLIIRGDKDATSDTSWSSELIRNMRGDAKTDEVIVHSAGHAIIWTHVDELSDILRKYE